MDNVQTNSMINDYLRPATFPVAVKLLKGPLPEKVKNPQQFYKHRLALCQGIAIARRHGRTIGFSKNDNNCPISQVLLGLAENPDINKNGSVAFPLYVKDLQAGKNTADSEVVLDVGTFDSIIFSPLHRADFTPDVLIIYGNPGQMVRLVQGALFNEGGVINSSFMGRGACADFIGYPFKSKKCNVVLGGSGERVFGMTGDEEMCFAIPQERITGVMEGLKATHDIGVARMPTPFFGLSAEAAFPASYKELLEHCELL